MITIGIDASRANTTLRTGTEWYAWSVLQEWKRLIPAADYRVVLYVKEPLLADLQPLPPHWQVKVLRWSPRLLWTQLRLSLHFIWPWNRPDVLYIPAHTIPIIHPKRVVYVAHDLGFEREPQLYSESLIGGRLMNVIVRVFTLGRYGTNEHDYHRWSMRFAVKHASRIIAISQFTANELKHFYSVVPAKVHVIYNGYQAPVQITAAVPTATAPVRDSLLYIGRIEKKKNLISLIQAYAKFCQASPDRPTLYCVGKPGYGFKEIEQGIHSLGIEQRVKLPGYVQPTDLLQYWQRARVFVLPSTYEGFGIPVLEAMAAGALVACSNLPPLREIGGGHCFYFNPDDVGSITAALFQAWSLPEDQRQQHVRRAQLHAQQFSWQRCAQETWQLIQQTVP